MSPAMWCAFGVLVFVWFFALMAVVLYDPSVTHGVRGIGSGVRNSPFFEKEERWRSKTSQWIQNETSSWLRQKEWRRSVSSSSDHDKDEGGIKDHPWELTPLEDAALLLGDDVGDVPLHVVFSTDCSPYQHWQSYQLFLSALRVRQPGRVTRIASGCQTSEERAVAARWHEEHVAGLSFRFGLHLTPQFSSVKDGEGKVVGSYEFFNKPFGLRHWMEHGEGMGIDAETGRPWKHDTIVVLLDPDMVLLRPITGRFASPGDAYRVGSLEQDGDNEDSPVSLDGQRDFKVTHGRPASQEYGFRDQWRKFAHVASGPGARSPAEDVTPAQASRQYAVGPPYLATSLDMYAIATRWTDFVPLVHKLYPELLAEMFAFCIAAAHLALPHQLMATLMISDTAGDSSYSGEGWSLIDQIPPDDICNFARNSLDTLTHPLPSVLHFCQRYGVGDTAFFAKKKLPRDFFTCDSPLLMEPPMDIGSGRYLYRKPPFLDTKVEYSAKKEKREAFMICAMTGQLNEAAIFFKRKHCQNSDNINYERTINLHDLPE